MSKTDQSLATIFAICDKVADSGETIRTTEQAQEDARVWMGFDKMPRNQGSENKP